MGSEGPSQGAGMGEPVSQGQFFAGVQQLHERIDESHTRLRAALEDGIARIERQMVAVSAEREKNTLRIEEHNGRIKSLEEKAGWIGAGVASAIIGAVTAIWHTFVK